ncbi:ZN622 protein, partial [Amia calva]|nr:ZN622 protein [Amia calva]
MSSYTCISCRVVFADGEVQRAHYKTDWHRYNLKRKVADMPPVTAENFQERVLAQRAAAEERERGGAGAPGGVAQCITCAKKFSSVNAHQNHLQSHKHQEAERRAMLAAQRKVEKMNEKNLEKGLGEQEQGLDHNAMNEAIKQALHDQQKKPSSSPAKAASKEKQRPEVPPRLQWFEGQARKIKEEEEGEDEEEWDDVDEEMDEEECGEMEEEEECDCGETDGASPQSSPPGSIPVTDCLFCPHHSRSLLKNLAHMTKAHGFFIPDVEYLVGLKGFIRYLGKQCFCVYGCNNHMTDKSHCKLFTDGDAALEFADFYDFRASYPDQKDGSDVEMQDGDLPDDKNLDYDEDTMELTLPSGAKVGHRSLMRYYKQRFGTQRTVALASNRNAVGRVLRQYKALGWGNDAARGVGLQSPRDMQYVQKMKSRWMLKMGMNNNANKQTHFRAQVMF